MIIVEQVIRDLLIQTNLCERRVFVHRAPQVPAEMQRVPFMIFFHVAPLPLVAHSGPLSLINRDYQVSIYDPSQTKALAIADSLRAMLDGFRADYEGVRFGGIFYRTQTHGYENETKLTEVVQEYRMFYRLIDPQPVIPTRSTNRKENKQWQPQS